MLKTLVLIHILWKLMVDEFERELKFKLSIRMGKKGDLSYFDCGRVIGARWAGLSISETDDLQGFSGLSISETDDLQGFSCTTISRAYK